MDDVDAIGQTDEVNILTLLERLDEADKWETAWEDGVITLKRVEG